MSGRFGGRGTSSLAAAGVSAHMSREAPSKQLEKLDKLINEAKHEMNTNFVYASQAVPLCDHCLYILMLRLYTVGTPIARSNGTLRRCEQSIARSNDGHFFLYYKSDTTLMRVI